MIDLSEKLNDRCSSFRFTDHKPDCIMEANHSPAAQFNHSILSPDREETMKHNETQTLEAPVQIQSRKPDLHMPAMPPLAMMDALDYRIRLAWYRLRKNRAAQRAQVIQRLQRPLA
jgi:hypothetical protein